MTYRVRRKFTSTTFRVGDHFCKVFFEPFEEFYPGFYLWNVGFGVAKSKRQLNDWYFNRNNKRRRSLRNQVTGPGTIETWRRAYEEILKLRWECLLPGDVMMLDCTSKYPERQFKIYMRWLKKHQDVSADPIRREIYWSRPPYHSDPLWDTFDIEGIVPKDVAVDTTGASYYDCFRIWPLDPCNDLSNEQITDLLNQVLTTEQEQVLLL